MNSKSFDKFLSHITTYEQWESFDHIDTEVNYKEFLKTAKIYCDDIIFGISIKPFFKFTFEMVLKVVKEFFKTDKNLIKMKSLPSQETNIFLNNFIISMLVYAKFM